MVLDDEETEAVIENAFLNVGLTRCGDVHRNEHGGEEGNGSLHGGRKRLILPYVAQLR